MQIKLGQDIIQMYEPYKNNAKWKTTIISDQKFQIYDSYEILDTINKFGIVVARDKEANDQKKLVAIKKIERVFEHKIFTKRTLRELRLLKLLKNENIIGVQTIMLPKSRQEFENIYVVFELMQTNLATIIKSDQSLTEEHFKFFLYQILRGLKYIHSANVVHRDLKPRNLLVNSNCDLKICDFGMARTIFPTKANILTDYVVIRWYRSPELLLNAYEYTTSVDIWSVGCIFAEMILRKPFLPGTDTKNQFELICEYFGTPNLDDIKRIPEESKKLIKSLPKHTGKVFENIFSNVSHEAIDLLKMLLIFDPEKRITAQDALKHPYLADLHIEQDQPSCQSLNPLDFEFQQHNLTTQQLKDILYQQILLSNNKQFYECYQKRKKEGKSLISHILKSSNSELIDPDADYDG